jgi:Fe-S cluster assembly protein SufD
MSAAPALKSWQAAFDARRDVSAQQRAAFAEFLKQGLPTTKNDAWKYTDLRRLAMKEFRAASGSSATTEGLLPFENAIVFVDGKLRPSPPSWGRDGERVFAFSESPSPQPSPTTGEGVFQKLNAAFANSEQAIELADDRQLYLVHAWTKSSGNAMSHPRITIKLPANRKTTLIEHHIGANADANFTNSVLDIEIGEYAALEHIRVQDDAAANFNIASIRANVARGASYVNHHYVLGSGLARTDLNVQLTGEQASTELHGLVFARDAQHLDVRTVIDHQVPNTQSREDYRGIADGRGRVVFNGKAIVAKDAQRTDAAQSSRNLLLSPHAEIDTRPELEIYANDVKCAHGATVGQLDATALFYLQSRGVAREEARALLIHAFAAEVIERIPIATVREHVLASFMERMRSGAAQ